MNLFSWFKAKPPPPPPVILTDRETIEQCMKGTGDRGIGCS